MVDIRKNMGLPECFESSAIPGKCKYMTIDNKSDEPMLMCKKCKWGEWKKEGND